MSAPCTPCIDPSRSVMAFFPGLKGDPGIQGPPGAASVVPGPIGPAGGVGVYVGAYVAGTVYYSNEFRHDIVAYAGRFWITNEPAKNGLNTWDAPNVDNWADFGTTLPTRHSSLACGPRARRC